MFSGIISFCSLCQCQASSGPFISNPSNTRLFISTFLFCFLLMLLASPVAAVLHFTVLYISWWREGVKSFGQGACHLGSVNCCIYLALYTEANPLIMPGCWITIAAGLAREKNSAFSAFTFCCLLLHCACLHGWGWKRCARFCTVAGAGTWSHPLQTKG